MLDDIEVCLYAIIPSLHKRGTITLGTFSSYENTCFYMLYTIMSSTHIIGAKKEHMITT